MAPFRRLCAWRRPKDAPAGLVHDAVGALAQLAQQLVLRGAAWRGKHGREAQGPQGC